MSPGHLFHKACWKKAETHGQHLTCPNCRARVPIAPGAPCIDCSHVSARRCSIGRCARCCTALNCPVHSSNRIPPPEEFMSVDFADIQRLMNLNPHDLTPLQVRTLKSFAQQQTELTNNFTLCNFTLYNFALCELCRTWSS